jgi:hypothetical protein
VSGESFEFIARFVKGREGFKRREFRYLFEQVDTGEKVFIYTTDNWLMYLYSTTKIAPNHYKDGNINFYFHDFNYNSLNNELARLEGVKYIKFNGVKY